jgi:hypothetical protein
MTRPWKTITSSPFLRVVLLSALLSSVACFVMWDHHRVNRDFRQLKALLTDVRWQTAGKDRTLVARFVDEAVSVTDNDTGVAIDTLAVPTLHQVNYDTTLGEDMIVFYSSGTGKYNKRVHGGDIRLRSWLGFRKLVGFEFLGDILQAWKLERSSDYSGRTCI